MGAFSYTTETQRNSSTDLPRRRCLFSFWFSASRKGDQMGEQGRAERHMYLPQIGLCLFAIRDAMELLTNWRCGHEVLAVIGLFAITGLNIVLVEE
jgi:hypothetical protein